MDSKYREVPSNEELIESLMELYSQSKESPVENSEIIFFDEGDENLDNLLPSKQKIRSRLIKFIETSYQHKEPESKENIHRK